mgnify:CR=1 FL=1
MKQKEQMYIKKYQSKFQNLFNFDKETEKKILKHLRQFLIKKDFYINKSKYNYKR